MLLQFVGLCRALRAAVEDPTSQIIYLSCHGNVDGISFSPQGDIIPYSTLSQWLHSMSPSDSQNETGFGEKTLIFGFCDSMNPMVGIENLMPPWVTQVAGFVNSPIATDVAQLAAGYVTNLNNWVHEVFSEYFRESIANPPRFGESPWEATGRAFNAAAETTPDYPAQNVLEKNRMNVVIATKDARTSTWIRKSGN